MKGPCQPIARLVSAFLIVIRAISVEAKFEGVSMLGVGNLWGKTLFHRALLRRGVKDRKTTR